jgi:hypothetical protein
MPTFLFNRQIRYVRYGGCKRLTDLTGLTADFRKAKLSGHSSATAFFWDMGHLIQVVGHEASGAGIAR